MSDFFDKIKNGGKKIKTFNEQSEHAKKNTPLPLMILNDSFILLVITAFLLLGAIGNWWHPAWLVFFLIPIYYMSVSAVVHRSPEMMPIGFIVVALYVSLGVFCGWWHPHWAMLIAIPLYYMSIAVIKGATWSKVFDILVPFIAVAVFLLLGILGGWWHPAWVVFLMIPLYFSWKGTVRKYKRIRQQEESKNRPDIQ